VEVKISDGNPITFNDRALTARMTGTLRRIAAGPFEADTTAQTTSEDFAYYQQKIPGMYFLLGVATKGANPTTLEQNHSPRFNPDEGALLMGVRALAHLAADFLAGVR